MNSRYLVVASLLLLVAAFFLLGVAWHGSASVMAAYPLSGASVQFCGSAGGGFALAGVASLTLGVLSLIGATVSALSFERGKKDGARRVVSRA